MIERYKKKVKKRIEDYCSLHYEKININQMKMGNGVFNQRCQLNAVQQVKEGNAEEVYSVICLSKSYFPFVHFINKDKDGYFVDHTLGWEYEIYDYYIVNKVDETQYLKINDVLMNIKEALINANSSSILNKILLVDKYNLGI